MAPRLSVWCGILRRIPKVPKNSHARIVTFGVEKSCRPVHFCRDFSLYGHIKSPLVYEDKQALLADGRYSSNRSSDAFFMADARLCTFSFE